MKAYRKVLMPTCPYCGFEQPQDIWDYNYQQLAGMANGRSGTYTVLRCNKCGEKYRVTCIIRFYSRKNLK